MVKGVEEVQVCLSSQGVFNICDARVPGFPIIYVSKGFVDLFEYSQAECLGKTCDRLVGGPSIRADGARLARICEASGLSRDEVAAGVDKLTCHAEAQRRLMVESPKESVRFALLLNRKKGGEIFVCESVMLALNRPELGWCYTIGIQRDVTRELSPKELLKAVAAGGYEAIVEARMAGVKSRLAHLGVAGDIAQYVQEAVVEKMRSRKAPQGRRGGSGAGPLGPRPRAWDRHSAAVVRACGLQRIPESHTEEARPESGPPAPAALREEGQAGVAEDPVSARGPPGVWIRPEEARKRQQQARWYYELEVPMYAELSHQQLLGGIRDVAVVPAVDWRGPVPGQGYGSDCYCNSW